MENETVSSNPVPTQASLDNKKNISHERIILVILVFFTLCFVAGIFFLKRSTTQSQQSTSSQVLSPTPSSIASSSAVIQQNQDPFDVPQLYPSLSWTPVATVSSSQQLLGEGGIYLTDKNLDYRVASIAGTQWVAIKDNLSILEINQLESKFNSYYNSELTKRGWTEDISANGYKITSINASGPGGGFLGYVASSNGNFRIIIFQNFLPVVESCPCHVTYYVFLSDIVPMENILPK